MIQGAILQVYNMVRSQLNNKGYGTMANESWGLEHCPGLGGAGVVKHPNCSVTNSTQPLDPSQLGAGQMLLAG
jgi:hypothetical protein